MRDMRHGILLFSLVAFGWSAAPATSQAGIVCKGMTWGYGWHGKKALSRVIARSDWKANAGPAWNDTSLAKSISANCRKENKAGALLWHCVFKAIPCRELGLSGGTSGTKVHNLRRLKRTPLANSRPMHWRAPKRLEHFGASRRGRMR